MPDGKLSRPRKSNCWQLILQRKQDLGERVYKLGKKVSAMNLEGVRTKSFIFRWKPLLVVLKRSSRRVVLSKHTYQSVTSNKDVWRCVLFICQDFLSLDGIMKSKKIDWNYGENGCFNYSNMEFSSLHLVIIGYETF